MKGIIHFAAVLLLAGITSAYADVSGNVGWDSEYIFRGVPQADSSANGGVDWEDYGFNAGVWLADVDEGLEIDYYGGWGGSYKDFGYSVGGTYYDYTDNFDSSYTELNLGGSWKWLSLDIAIGEHDLSGAPDEDYTYFELTAERNGFFATYGNFSDDLDGSYFKAGYTYNLKGFDLTGYYVYSDSDLVFGVGGLTGSESNLVAQVSYSFAFEDAWNAFKGVAGKVAE